MCVRNFTLACCVLLAFLGLALAPAPVVAQDPIKVAGDLYKVISENDQVRILDVRLAPGQKTAMHSHPDLVAVILRPGKTKWTTADGKSRESEPGTKRGSVIFMNAETHISENTGNTRLQVILVEFKKPAPGADRGAAPSLPAPFTQVADNPHARVFEGSPTPGTKIAEHTHGDHIIIALTNAVVEVTDKDGKPESVTFKRDSAQFSGPATHSAVVKGRSRARLIDIELK